MKKRKISKKYFTVNESIFNQKVHILLNYSKKDYVEWIKKLDPDYQDDRHDMFLGWSVEMENDGKLEWIICVKDFNWTINHQGTLIHEIVHTIIKIWKSNNIPFTPDNQEFLAQSVSNLWEDITAKIFNAKKLNQ